MIEDVSSAAVEILENLLSLMGIVGRVEILPCEDALSLNVEGDDLSILIGRQGRTLAALEYVVRLILVGQSDARSRVIVDVAGYRKKRQDSLKEMALRMATQVKLKHRPISLLPMSPSERRVVHLALADDNDIVTLSEGEGEGRRVVISPRQDG